MKKERNIANLFRQIIKFGFVGGIAFVIDYFFLFAFTEWLGVYYIISACISFSIAVIFNYVASVVWVFDVDASKDKKSAFFVFIALSALGLVMNQVIMWCGVEMIGIHYLFVKVISTAIVMVFNFVTRKMFLE